MERAKIVLIDDHSLFRIGVKAVIAEGASESDVVAEYDSGEEFLEDIGHESLPDLVILDIIMPGLNGVEVAKRLRILYPKVKIMMLSTEVSGEIIEELLDIGVNAYLSKLVVKDELNNAIKKVLEGEHFFGQDIARIMYGVYKTNQEKVKNATLPWKKNKLIQLTNREKDLIEELCSGKTIKEIAEDLTVSPKTVSNHKFNIMKKLGFHSSVELVKYAVKKGIVTL